MCKYILNAFSINMLNAFPLKVSFKEIALEEAQSILANHAPDSGVGHTDTARVFGGLLGQPVNANRINVSLDAGDKALIGQYKGPRLPEGATSLPEGATIVWVVASVE